MMRNKKNERGKDALVDFDLAKSCPGEVGPNVADELAAK